MSKRHFNAIARQLANVRPEDESGCAYIQWLHDIKAVASVCSDANNRFDHHRFIDACIKWERK